MMCYRLGKENKTCLGERQLRGRITWYLSIICIKNRGNYNGPWVAAVCELTVNTYHLPPVLEVRR